MDKNVKVSVLIVTYNYANYISDAIESILRQDYETEKMELIIIDDGSKDNTKDIIEPFFRQIDLKYIFQNNQGKASATKLGISIAGGKYLFVLDADDYYHSNCISTVVELFEKNEDVVQISHLPVIFDERTSKSTLHKNNNPMVNRPVDGLEMLYNNIFKNYTVGLGSTFAGKLIILKDIVIPDEIDMYIDYYLYLKLMSKGKIIQLNYYLSVFRRHDRSYSEGTQKFENAKMRSLRYLKSAQKLYNEVKEDKINDSVKNAIKLFYYQHLIEASKYEEDKRLNISIEMLVITIKLFWRYTGKFRFLINNIKILING